MMGFLRRLLTECFLGFHVYCRDGKTGRLKCLFCSKRL